MKSLLYLTVACLLLMPFYNSYAYEVHPMDGSTYTVEGPNSNSNAVWFSLPGTMHMPTNEEVSTTNFASNTLCPAQCVITTKSHQTITALLVKEFYKHMSTSKPYGAYYLIDNKHPATADLSGLIKNVNALKAYTFHIVNLGCNNKDKCVGDPKKYDIKVQCTETYQNDPYCYRDRDIKPKGK